MIYNVDASFIIKQINNNNIINQDIFLLKNKSNNISLYEILNIFPNTNKKFKNTWNELLPDTKIKIKSIINSQNHTIVQKAKIYDIDI